MPADLSGSSILGLFLFDGFPFVMSVVVKNGSDSTGIPPFTNPFSELKRSG